MLLHKGNLAVGKVGKDDLKIYILNTERLGDQQVSGQRKSSSAEPLTAGQRVQGSCNLLSSLPVSQSQRYHPLLPAEAKTQTNIQFNSCCCNCWQNQGVRLLMVWKQPYISSFFESIIRFHNYAKYGGSRIDEKFVKQTVLPNRSILHNAERLQVYNQYFFYRGFLLFWGK